MPSRSAICLFSNPFTTNAITSRSLAVSVAYPVTQPLERGFLLERGTAALERLANGVEQLLAIERLRQNLDRPRLHRFHRHRDAAVSGDEDDWHLVAAARELLLKGKAVEVRQVDVEDQTARHGGELPAQELLR